MKLLAILCLISCTISSYASSTLAGRYTSQKEIYFTGTHYDQFSCEMSMGRWTFHACSFPANDSIVVEASAGDTLFADINTIGRNGHRCRYSDTFVKSDQEPMTFVSQQGSCRITLRFASDSSSLAVASEQCQQSCEKNANLTIHQAIKN